MFTGGISQGVLNGMQANQQSAAAQQDAQLRALQIKQAQLALQKQQAAQVEQQQEDQDLANMPWPAMFNNPPSPQPPAPGQPSQPAMPSGPPPMQQGGPTPPQMPQGAPMAPPMQGQPPVQAMLPVQTIGQPQSRGAIPPYQSRQAMVAGGQPQAQQQAPGMMVPPPVSQQPQVESPQDNIGTISVQSLLKQMHDAGVPYDRAVKELSRYDYLLTAADKEKARQIQAVTEAQRAAQQAYKDTLDSERLKQTEKHQDAPGQCSKSPNRSNGFEDEPRFW